MQLQQLMTPAPQACVADTNLCEAVRMLWDGDFGALPVVDDAGHVVGMLTDRDIAMALGTRDRQASGMTAAEVMSRAVHCCHVHDQVGTALKAMRDHQVRRIPVLDADNRLCGIFTLNDAVMMTDTAVAPGTLVKTLRSVCARRKEATQPLVLAAV